MADHEASNPVKQYLYHSDGEIKAFLTRGETFVKEAIFTRVNPFDENISLPTTRDRLWIRVREG